MASLRGYCTATNVRDFLSGQVNTYLTDAMIDTMISDIEGVVDGWLKMGASGLTFSATKSLHLIVRRAVVSGTAILVLASSSLSWQTLEQAVNARDIATYEWETCYKIITGDAKPIGIGDDIVNA